MAAVRCERCGGLLPIEASYVVRIDVFADPSPPEDLGDAAEPCESIESLIDQMRDQSADDLMDQVHRRFEYRLCRPCQSRFIANPLSLPRPMPYHPN